MTTTPTLNNALFYWQDDPIVKELVQKIAQKNNIELSWFTEKNVSWSETIPTLLAALKDPVWLPELKRAAKVLIHGDYDVDGITSTRMAYDCLHYLNPEQQFAFVLPKREDGYGFTENSVKKVQEFAPDFLLVFDCGSNDLPLYKYAEENPAVRVVVFDHHIEQNNHPCPENLTIINSHRFGLKLCSAGLAFSFVYSLTGEIAFRSNALGMAALGTVADAVPLNCLENLVLVQEGLRFLNQKKPVWATKLSGKNYFDATTLGFYLGPRINAISRVGDDPKVAFQALGGDEEAMASLETANQTRQKEVEEALNDFISKQLDKITGDVVLIELPIAPGYAGILAAKICELTHKPALVACYSEKEDNNKVVGSARSFGGVDLMTIFEQIKDDLVGYGGHTLAAGFSYLHPQIHKLQTKVKKIKLPQLAEAKVEDVFPLELSSQWQFAAAIANYLTEPHGVGNPAFRYSMTGDLYRLVSKAGGKFTSVCLRAGNQKVDFMIWDTYENVSQQILPLAVDGIINNIRVEFSASFNPEKTDFPTNFTVEKIFWQDQILYDPKRKKVYENKRTGEGNSGSATKYQSKLPVSELFQKDSEQGLL